MDAARQRTEAPQPLRALAPLTLVLGLGSYPSFSDSFSPKLDRALAIQFVERRERYLCVETYALQIGNCGHFKTRSVLACEILIRFSIANKLFQSHYQTSASVPETTDTYPSRLGYPADA